jgi:quercetin dioxygenase-like cupin family protein
MVSITIADEIARLKEKPEWSSEDRLAVSLVKDGALNVLLMVLRKEAQLKEHRTRGPIALHVLSGVIRFSTGTEHATLSAGSMVGLDRDVLHSLEALEESVVLLTTAIS